MPASESQHPFAYLSSLVKTPGCVISVTLLNSTMDLCIEATNNIEQGWKPISLNFTSGESRI